MTVSLHKRHIFRPPAVAASLGPCREPKSTICGGTRTNGKKTIAGYPWIIYTVDDPQPESDR
jgi:hypothetical protein